MPRLLSRPAWPDVFRLSAALFPSVATAAVVVQEKELLPRIEKVFVTTQLQLLDRRAVSVYCPTNYSLCPSSLGGGCCPTRYACETDACVQTTTTTATACGRAGYFNCGIEAAGGCCPVGYVCGVNDCTAPAGVTNSEQCPTSYYLCAASYNYGCCQVGMGCALDACYATTPTTLTFTETFTTTTDSTGSGAVTTITSTTVETPTAPSGLPTSDTTAYVAKFLPSTQTKVAEITSTSSSKPSSSSGMTKAQIGGLIGGLVALVIVILVVSFFIIRNLRKTAKAYKSRHGSSVGGSGRSASDRTGGPSGSGRGPVARPKMTQVQPTPSQVDQMEYDDLLDRETVAASPATRHAPSPSGASSDLRNAGYQALAMVPSPELLGSRKVSPETGSENAVPHVQELPARVHNRPGRHSTSTRTEARTSTDDSQGQQHRHASLWQQFRRARLSSNDGDHSETPSQGLGSPRQPAELGIDGGLIPELPSAALEGAGPEATSSAAAQPGQAPGRERAFSGVSALSGSTSFFSSAMRPSLDTTHSRNHSDSSTSTAGGVPGPHQPYQPHQQQQHQPPTLGVVSEAVEHMHGHYGPTDVAAGQTRAGMNMGVDISSPIVP